MSRTVGVYVQVDLSEISADSLLGELTARKGHLPVESIVNTLEDMGCPKDILDPLKEWMSVPVADEVKLRAWLQACGNPIWPETDAHRSTSRSMSGSGAIPRICTTTGLAPTAQHLHLPST